MSLPIIRYIGRKVDFEDLPPLIVLGIALLAVISYAISEGGLVTGGIILGSIVYLIGFCWGVRRVYRLCMQDHPARYDTFYEVRDGAIPALAGGLAWPVVLAIDLIVKLVKKCIRYFKRKM